MKIRYCIISLLLTARMAAAETEPPRYLDRIIEREGIRIHVRMEALESDAPVLPRAGEFVRLWLEGKRLADDQPISNWRVGAWLDRETDTMSGAVPVCGQRIARYLSGNLLQRRRTQRISAGPFCQFQRPQQFIWRNAACWNRFRLAKNQ